MRSVPRRRKVGSRVAVRLGNYVMNKAGEWRMVNEFIGGVSKVTGIGRQAVCEQCAGTFQYVRGKMFCSHECRSTWNIAHRKPRMTACATCGEEFAFKQDRIHCDRHLKLRKTKEVATLSPEADAMRRRMRDINWRPMGQIQVQA